MQSRAPRLVYPAVALDHDPCVMIRYHFKNAEILFVGINPHEGSFRRGVPFSNNKTFWYLLSRAGLIEETVDFLRDDKRLKAFYTDRVGSVYRLGFINLIERPTRNTTLLEKHEELLGRRRIDRILRVYRPKVVCFVGKITYEKYRGAKCLEFGWQEDIEHSKIFVMHFPLRGPAEIRIDELRTIQEERNR